MAVTHLRVTGTARNTTHPNKAVDIVFMIGGTRVGSTKTSPPDTSFSAVVEAVSGPEICAHTVGGQFSRSCLPTPYTASPIGHVDLVTPGLRGFGGRIVGGIRVAGWALDPDRPDPIRVDVYNDDRRVAVLTADAPRPDIAAAFPGYGDRHGYDTVVPAEPGKRICVHAINDQGPSAVTGCKRIQPSITIEAAGSGRRPVALTTSPDPPGYFRARRNDTVRLTAGGAAGAFGMRRLTVASTRTVVCVTGSGNEIAVRQQSTREKLAPRPTPARPFSRPRIQLRFALGVPVIRATCRPDRFRELRLRVVVSAENRLGSVSHDEAVVTSFGPDFLKIGTFNMEQTEGRPDSAYEAWARDFGSRADVLLLSETKDVDRVDKVAKAGGFRHHVQFRDVAILSRGPLSAVRQANVKPDDGKSRSGSTNLAAWTDLSGYPHQVMSVHWAINNADNERVTALEPLPGHYRAAEWIVAKLTPPDFERPPPAPTFVGGDTNAYSGKGPQSAGPGSTPAMQLLARHMTDAYRFHLDDNPFLDPAALHCSDQRIDYVFSVGSYVPVNYESCFPGMPSNHPFVLVTYAVQDRPAPPSGPVR
jgi:endonuclease/exonuclease/phosphatase family protein